jgi:hypothetical protein
MDASRPGGTLTQITMWTCLLWYYRTADIITIDALIYPFYLAKQLNLNLIQHRSAYYCTYSR